MAENQAKQFTNEEIKGAMQLASLVQRQITMGVPPALALGVLAGALGSVAHEQEWKEEDLPNLLPIITKGFQGAAVGAEQRKKGGG